MAGTQTTDTQKPNTLKHRAVLALGSNLGESEDTLERAVADLVAGGVQLVRAPGCTVPPRWVARRVSRIS